MAFAVDRYLFRLGVKRAKPTIDWLKSLQRAHQQMIPLENFDIFLGKKRQWNMGTLFDKIIPASRGGLGIELNALFGELLAQLGFRCMLIAVSPTVKDQKPHHVAQVVNVDGELWLVDVGRPVSVVDPVLLKAGEARLNFTRYVRTQVDNEGWWRYETSGDLHQFKTEYVFRLREHKMIEFLHLHDELQSIYVSPHAKEPSISKIHDQGRLTLTPSQMCITHGTATIWSEDVHHEEDFDARLMKNFGFGWQALV